MTAERLLREGKSDLNTQVQTEKELFNTMKEIISSSDDLATEFTDSTLKEMKNDPEKYQINKSMVEYLDDNFYQSKAEDARSALYPEKLFGIGIFLGNKTSCCLKQV